MESKDLKCPKVFISYSWTSPDHEEWVSYLAKRLADSGVNVVFDKWDLKDGQDVYVFMESMVNSPEIDRALIICDQGYKEKADNRKGGVGTETLIITPEIYGNASQEKFIPILAERNSEGHDYRPTYLKTRKYIDLSLNSAYEENFERLLRTLFGKPEHQRPALGKPPAWLFEEEIPHFKTENILRQLRDALYKNPKKFRALAGNFVEAFFEELEPFRILDTKNRTTFDETILEAIEKTLPLRNDYVSFLEILCENNARDHLDTVVSFFENLYQFGQPTAEMSSYTDVQWDHIKFLLQEFFIYTICVYIEQKEYKTLFDLLNTQFFVREHLQMSNITYINYRQYIRTLDEFRKSRLNLNLLSPVANLLIERANLKKYPKEKIVNSDLMLYYFSLIFLYDQTDYYWYPATYIYKERGRSIELLYRLISARHYENMKELFGVKSPEELKQLLKEHCSVNARGYSGGLRGIPAITNFIDIDKIASIS